MREMETMRATGLSRISMIAACVAGVSALLLAAAQPASASQRLTRSSYNISLKVDSKGHAVVYYTRAGKRYHPVVWGAINARPSSMYPTPQVKFRIDYSGGTQRLGYPLWKTIRNVCRPYSGPRLPWLVTACTAPNGSHWAIQRFRRLLPGYGVKPWLWYQPLWEIHISHWEGPLPKLEVYQDWVYSVRRRELFGRLTYQGKPVYGFSATRAGVPQDSYGRLVSVDTYNSPYGSGWKRENSFLTQRPGGNWCYHFVPHNPPSWYPSSALRPPGVGSMFRVTAGGPGVTPFVRWTGRSLPAYDEGNPDHVQLEQDMNAKREELAALDDGCHQN
jgi:hypothetical protein